MPVQLDQLDAIKVVRIAANSALARPADHQMAGRRRRSPTRPAAAAGPPSDRLRPTPCGRSLPPAGRSPAASSASASPSGCAGRTAGATELLGHRLRRPEIDHVERAERHHLRHAAPAAAVSRSGPADSTPPTSSSASSVVVMSRTPAMRPSVDQRLHRLAAGAGGVEDQHLVARLLEHCRARLGDARGGDAEHRGRHQRLGPRRTTGAWRSGA